MILLPHAKRIAHDSGRGMALPGLYSGCFLFGASRTACIATCSGSLPNELAKVPKSEAREYESRASNQN